MVRYLLKLVFVGLASGAAAQTAPVPSQCVTTALAGGTGDAITTPSVAMCADNNIAATGYIFREYYDDPNTATDGNFCSADCSCGWNCIRSGNISCWTACDVEFGWAEVVCAE